MAEVILFYFLMAFILIAALIAVETTDLLSAVICVGAIGFGCALFFLFLRAPDIAITQIVVEVLALVILIRVTISRNATFVTGDREFFASVVSVVILMMIFLMAVQVLNSLPAFGDAVFAEVTDSASKTYISQGMEKTGAANIVSAVILDFRAYDTLGEATVLFTSVIGAAVILRKRPRKLPEEPQI